VKAFFYRVKARSSLKQALNAALRRQFAIALVDYRLGSLRNGPDLIEELQFCCPHARFVMITADVEGAMQVCAARWLPDIHNRKPRGPLPSGPRQQMIQFFVIIGQYWGCR
jgi:DNA-binding NarL/FixJ family response regulator